MIQNTLGVVLSYYREKLDISLEQMADGICSVSTLHRVEMGGREADSYMAESLLGRIGKEVTFFELVINNEDYEFAQLRNRIQELVRDGAFSEAREGIKEYRNWMTEKQRLHEQFLRYQELLIAMGENADENLLCQLAKNALACTGREISGLMNNSLFNPTEMFLVKTILLTDKSLESKDVLEVLQSMLEYVKEYYSGELGYRFKVDVYMDMVRYCFQKDMYLEVLSYADQAIEVISQGRWVLQCGELRFLKGKSMVKLMETSGRTKEAIAQCKKELMMAYCVYDVMRQDEKAADIRDYAGKEFQWDITKLEI